MPPTKKKRGKAAAKKRPSPRTARSKPRPKRAAREAVAAGKKTWIVTTSADRPLAEIARDLSAAGFAVANTMEQIGIITGKSDAGTVRKARAIRGVADISPDQEIEIGPPGSRETW